MNALTPLSPPVSAGDMLPHRPPMLCVDALVATGDASAAVTAFLGPDHILLHEGACSEAGLVELAAQAVGVMKGYAEQRLGMPVKDGFLAAVQDFSCLSPAREGDSLRIHVAVIAEMAGVSLIETAIYRDSGPGPAAMDLVARGRLKLFVPESD